MLSAAGIPQQPEDWDFSKIRTATGKKPPQWAKSIANKIWKSKVSPFGIMRKTGKHIGKKMIKSYLNKRMADLPKDEFNDM